MSRILLVMLVAVKKFPEFFDVNGLKQREFVPPGLSVAAHSYVQSLLRLRDAVPRNYQLHITCRAGRSCPQNIPYSLDLTLSGFCQFSVPKMGLSETGLATVVKFGGFGGL
jgi:hypothetical protein